MKTTLIKKLRRPKPKNEDDLTIMENSIQKQCPFLHTYTSKLTTLGGGRRILLCITMLLSLFPESFVIFLYIFGLYQFFIMVLVGYTYNGFIYDLTILMLFTGLTGAGVEPY